MFPTISCFGREIPTYSICGVAGWLAGAAVVYRNAKKCGFDPETGLLVYLKIWAGALIGAKLFYCATVLPQILRDGWMIVRLPKEFLQRYLTGGLVFYGGLAGALLIVLWEVYKCRRPFALLERVYLPALPLSHALGRLGCFFAGCCYGKPTSGGWGVYYPAKSLAPSGVALVPVQLYECFGEIGIFLLLNLICNHWEKPGKALGCYLFLYGGLRLMLEALRGDWVRGLIFGVSQGQIISVVVICIGAFLLFRKSRQEGYTP